MLIEIRFFVYQQMCKNDLILDCRRQICGLYVEQRQVFCVALFIVIPAKAKQVLGNDDDNDKNNGKLSHERG